MIREIVMSAAAHKIHLAVLEESALANVVEVHESDKFHEFK